jgi:hypothetical protein
VINTGLPALGVESAHGPVGRRVGPCRSSLKALRPHPQSLTARQILGSPGHDVARPIVRHGYPLVGREEDRLGDSDAADHPVAAEALRVGSAETVQASQQIVLVAGSVGLAEDIPGTPHRKALGAREQAEAADRVVLALQLEEERRARWDRLEWRAARTPEVHLGDVGPRSKELVPAVVRWRDKAKHGPIVACASGRRKPRRIAPAIAIVAARERAGASRCPVGFA